MSKYLLDLLFLNEYEDGHSFRTQANWLGIFVVTCFVIMSFGHAKEFTADYFGWNDSGQLEQIKSDLDGISEAVRDRDFNAAQSIDELDSALIADYEDAFNKKADQLHNSNAIIESLKEQLETKNAEFKECRYPGVLDSHRN